jgi:hypothetical protein
VAASRTDFDATLVRLWNEIERARLAGDKGRLREIERAAARIQQRGDEAQQREAGRLLDELRELREDEGTAAATERLDAEVEMGGQTIRDWTPPVETRSGEALPETYGEEAEDEEPRGLRRLMPLLWILVFVVVLILNLLGSRE